MFPEFDLSGFGGGGMDFGGAGDWLNPSGNDPLAFASLLAQNPEQAGMFLASQGVPPPDPEALRGGAMGDEFLPPGMTLTQGSIPSVGFPLPSTLGPDGLPMHVPQVAPHLLPGGVEPGGIDLGGANFPQPAVVASAPVVPPVVAPVGSFEPSDGIPTLADSVPLPQPRPGPGGPMDIRPDAQRSADLKPAAAEAKKSEDKVKSLANALSGLKMPATPQLEWPKIQNLSYARPMEGRAPPAGQLAQLIAALGGAPMPQMPQQGQARQSLALRLGQALGGR